MDFCYALSDNSGSLLAQGDCVSTDYFEANDVAREHIENIVRIVDTVFNKVSTDYADYSMDIQFAGHCAWFRCTIQKKEENQ